MKISVSTASCSLVVFAGVLVWGVWRVGGVEGVFRFGFGGRLCGRG